MNIGFEDDELKPYVEPPPDINDPLRIGNCIKDDPIWLVQFLFPYLTGGSNMLKSQ